MHVEHIENAFSGSRYVYIALLTFVFVSHVLRLSSAPAGIVLLYLCVCVYLPIFTYLYTARLRHERVRLAR